MDTTVSRNTAGARDSLGLATTFNRGANFGKATGNTQTNLSTTGINAFPLAFQGRRPGAARSGWRWASGSKLEVRD